MRTEVRAAEHGGLIYQACEKTGAQGAKRNKADPELLKGREYFFLRLPPPERIFTLNRRDGLNGVSPADRLSAWL